MQCKCLLVKNITKRILQTIKLKAHYLDGLNLNNNKNGKKIYPLYLILQQGIMGTSHMVSEPATTLDP